MSSVPRAAVEITRAWLERATAIDREIAARTLPFWYDHAYVGSRAGYRLGEDAAKGRFEEDGQLVVSQARLVWAFARAHRMGYSNADRDYLLAARHGFDHLQSAFLDPQFGGYYWRVRANGDNDRRKVLYGQSFVLYALVECAAAAADAKILATAADFFRLLEKSGPANSPPLSTAEIAERDFSPAPLEPKAADRLEGVTAAGYRCSNTTLHWMEALTDLCRALPEDKQIRTALEASLDLNATKCYPRDLDKGIDYVPGAPDVPPWPKPKQVSYGHNVEFGWLMLAAQQALGIEPDWARVEPILDHTLRWGFDTKHGGIFNSGKPASPADDRVKNWWPQAEMIAALTYLISSGRASRSFDPELKLMLDWYEGPQMHASTGTPYEQVDEDGTHVLRATLSGQWQAAYHDLRARWIFIEAMRAR